MHKNQPTTDTIAKPSIEAFALPCELRRTHNFASRARPIIGLDLPLTPPAVGDTGRFPARLSHTPPRRRAALPETDFLIESRFADADPPMNLPASWREPAKPAQRQRRGWGWTERSTAAFSGFAAGLIVILPLVFILGANQPATPPALTATTTPGFEFSLASTRAYFNKLWQPAPLSAIKTSSGEPSANHDAPAAAPPAAEDQARSALRAGRIEEARSTLRSAASPDNPRLWLLLAETYDPARTANAGPAAASLSPASDTTRPTDVEFARFYYRQALTYGIEEARPRLDALSTP